MPTTVASMAAMPEPSTVAAMTHRPTAELYTRPGVVPTRAQPKSTRALIKLATISSCRGSRSGLSYRAGPQ